MFHMLTINSAGDGDGDYFDNVYCCVMYFRTGNLKIEEIGAGLQNIGCQTIGLHLTMGLFYDALQERKSAYVSFYMYCKARLLYVY